MADAYPGAPTAGPVFAPSVFTHPPVDSTATPEVAPLWLMPWRVILHCVVTQGRSVFETFPRHPLCQQPGYWQPRCLNFWIIDYVLPVDRRHEAFILINATWLSPVIAIVGE